MKKILLTIFTPRPHSRNVHPQTLVHCILSLFGEHLPRHVLAFARLPVKGSQAYSTDGFTTVPSLTFWHCYLFTLAQEKEKDQSRLLTTQNWSSCTFSITNVTHLRKLAYGMTSAPKNKLHDIIKRGFERHGKNTSTAFLLSLNIPDNLLFLSHISTQMLACTQNTLKPARTHTHTHTHTHK